HGSRHGARGRRPRPDPGRAARAGHSPGADAGTLPAAARRLRPGQPGRLAAAAGVAGREAHVHGGGSARLAGRPDAYGRPGPLRHSGRQHRARWQRDLPPFRRRPRRLGLLPGLHLGAAGPRERVSRVALADCADSSGSTSSTVRRMAVDQELVEAAIELARTRFPGQDWSGAAALRLDDGAVLTSTAPDAPNSAVSLCYETGAMCEAFKRGRRVVESV